MGLRNDHVAISHEVTTQVIIAHGGVVVHERTALDGDGAGVTIVLVENIVFSTIAVIGVEEATLDNDVAIVAFDDRVAITIGIAANSVITQHYRFFEIAFKKSVYDSKNNLMRRAHLSFDSSVVSETAPSSRSVTT